MSARPFVRAGLVAVAIALAAPVAADASFTVVPSPNAPVGESILNGVSAGSPNGAWAVGSRCCATNNFGRGTLTEHWNGRVWSIVPSPDTRFNDDTLNSVVGLGPSDGWAVGEIKQSGYRSGTPLLLRWNGSAWQTVAPPTGVTGKLLSVGATGSSNVWAVGDDGHGHPLALRFNGVTLSRVPVPQVGPTDHLRGVRVFGPSDVWVVGDTNAGGEVSTLVLHWNGATWAHVFSPSPDPYSNILHAVGGVSTRDLWAVGKRVRDKADTGVAPGARTLILHWNGTSWTTVASPNTGDQDILRGVAAKSATDVTAVGGFQSPTTGAERTLGERWNGASWLLQATPNVGTSDNLLRGVTSIPGTPDVWAVGQHYTSGGPIQTLVLRGP